MTRRTLMQLPAAAAAPSLSAAQPTPAAGGRKPNILFLMVDQMTPFMIGPYGQKAAITPNLDRLARGGAVAGQAIQVGSDGGLLSVGADHERGHLIDHEEEDVRLPAGGPRTGLRRGGSGGRTGCSGRRQLHKRTSGHGPMISG